MEFVELTHYRTLSDTLLSFEDKDLLEKDLINNPEKGDLITGTGGARKIRVRQGNKGKSGGARSIYYYKNENHQIWFLAIYPKNAKSNLSAEEKKILKVLIREIKEI